MIIRNTSLKKFNTFGLDYSAECLITIKSENEAKRILKSHEIIREPVIIIGGGSNLLFTGDFKGTIIHPEIKGVRIEERSKDSVVVSAGAGVVWDELVEWTVKKGFGGLENLSLIPGMTGAAPVQNIGAYGSEAKDTIEKVRAISISDGAVRDFANNECRFGYRKSIFKEEFKNRFLITNVWFRLNTNPLLNTVYGSVREETDKLGPVTLENVRKAVISIRSSKLPDPAKIGNAGSFFKNPVIGKAEGIEFRQKHPLAPCFDDPSGGTKIAAGWLIEQCGWKGIRKGDAGVHDKQALVLVNYGNATGMEILELSEEIKKSVADKFGIELCREVEIL